MDDLVRVVRESHASAAFLENVPEIIKGIDTVRCAFTGLGFAMRWCVVSAADVGAPHVRKTVVLSRVPSELAETSTNSECNPRD